MNAKMTEQWRESVQAATSQERAGILSPSSTDTASSASSASFLREEEDSEIDRAEYSPTESPRPMEAEDPRQRFLQAKEAHLQAEISQVCKEEYQLRHKLEEAEKHVKQPTHTKTDEEKLKLLEVQDEMLVERMHELAEEEWEAEEAEHMEGQKGIESRRM